MELPSRAAAITMLRNMRRRLGNDAGKTTKYYQRQKTLLRSQDGPGLCPNRPCIISPSPRPLFVAPRCLEQQSSTRRKATREALLDRLVRCVRVFSGSAEQIK